MSPEPTTTRFADLSPSRARLSLLIFVVGTLALVAGSFIPPADVPEEFRRGLPKTRLEGAEVVAVLAVAPDAGFPGALPWGALGLSFPEDAPDLALYRAIVRRVHDGEAYYPVAQEELRKRGYPTRSVFNWRPPTYAWFFALLPGPVWVQVLLLLLCLVALALAYWGETRRSNVLQASGLILFLTGPFAWCLVQDAFFSQEVWAGTLIVLSLAAYAVGWRPIGVLAGLAALFLRELALPYVLVAAGVALWQRRKGEAAAWIMGLLGFAGLLLWHAQQVQGRITVEDERVFSEGWLRLGGIPFVLLTGRMNRYLFDAPRWIVALWLAVALLGLVARRGEAGQRLLGTALIYVLAFLVVGNPRINDYWGLLYVGVLPFGVVEAPRALWDVVCRARAGEPERDIAGLSGMT